MADAVLNAARLLKQNWGHSLKPEERLRRAIAASALESASVLEVRIRPEWRPALTLWPSKPGNPLGGFDLAFRMKGDGEISVAAETKWAGGTKVDALDETPWDVLKLVHARTLQHVRWALLVTGAPAAAWGAARYARMFDEQVISIHELLALNPHMFEEDAKSRPLSLPPYVQSSPVARVPLDLNGQLWEIRVASVRADGEPWLDCDEDGWPTDGNQTPVLDWPHPEPGMGLTDDDALSDVPLAEQPQPLAANDIVLADIPGSDASWWVIGRFAERHDGYALGADTLASLANASLRHFQVARSIDARLSIDELRSCLFFETRRYHHLGHVPGFEGAEYIRALLTQMRVSVEQSRHD